MQLLKNYTRIHGFEDYNIVSMGDSCFNNTWGFYIPYKYDVSTGTYLINKDLASKPCNKVDQRYDWLKKVYFEPELVRDNKELLLSAKKVFVHPSCKLSRSLMAEKYKKSLNPYLSDAVVLPKPDYSEFDLSKEALFINEQAKLIVMAGVNNEETHNHIKNITEGVKFKDVITCNPNDSYGDRKSYKTEDMLNAEFFYYGEVLYIPNSQSWAMEVLTHQIPVNKVVFEESVQESLSNEANQLDFDSLCSIKDMLESSDENTVAAGLKSLSMMDWMHYPNSIKFILNNISNKYNWIYNKACNSTSVKYMIKTICKVSRRSLLPGRYDEEIYEDDFELFKKLKCHYHHIQQEKFIEAIRSIDFIKVNSDGFLIPNIKATA